MNPSAEYALAIDIGGSHVSAAMVDLTTRDILPPSRTRITVDPDASAEDILDIWSRAALSALSKWGMTSVTAIGIAMPGPFDYQSGISWLQHKFRSLYGQNIIDLLMVRWRATPLAGTPIRIANDAGVYALGEWWAGAAHGYDRVIGLTLGTGLGSGFIRNGQIISTDPHVPPGGEIWNIPYRDGIAEDYASGRAIAGAYTAATGQSLSVAKIAQRASMGDTAASAAFDALGNDLAGILRPHVTQFDPTCIVVGGNIAHAWPLFGAHLQTAWPEIACCPSTRFDDASLLGAAALFESA